MEFATNLTRITLRSFAFRAANAASIFGVAVVLARALGPMNYGLYTFAVALVTVLAIPAQLGLPDLLVREIARHRTQHRWDLIGALVRVADRTVLIASVFISAAVGLIIYSFPLNIPALDTPTVVWALLLLPIMAFAVIQGSAIRGLGLVLSGQLPDQLLRPGALLLLSLVALALVGSNSLRAQDAMTLHVIAGTIGVLYGIVKLRRSVPHTSRVEGVSGQTQRWLISAGPFALIAGLQVINNQADALLIGFLASGTEVGTYRVAVQAAALVGFGLGAVNMVVAPRIVELYSAGDSARLQRIVTSGARAVMATALPTAGVLILAGDFVLVTVFGSEYRDAAFCLAILSIGQIVNATMASVGVLLNMTGHENDTLKGVFIAAVFNVLFNLLLIPPYGIEGAAVATAASVAIWNVHLAWLVRRRLGISVTIFARRSEAELD